MTKPKTAIGMLLLVGAVFLSLNALAVSARPGDVSQAEKTTSIASATAAIARRNLERTGVAKRVRIEVGSALEIVPRLDGPFDLVFNDIDKTHYLDVLPHCISKLRVGGLLVTDNVLWSGRVAKGRRTKEAEVIHEYNQKLAADPRFVVVIVPLRDGVSIAHKVRD